MALSKAEAARLNGKRGGRPRKDGSKPTPPSAETQKPTETYAPHPLLLACTRKEQAFLLALLADPETNQTKAYESAGFTARGESASANAARLLGKDRVRAAYVALRGVVAESVVGAAIATLEEKRGILTTLARDVGVHPLARIRAIDVDNKVEGVYIEKHVHAHVIPGAITFLVTQQAGAENRT